MIPQPAAIEQRHSGLTDRVSTLSSDPSAIGGRPAGSTVPSNAGSVTSKNGTKLSFLEKQFGMGSKASSRAASSPGSSRATQRGTAMSVAVRGSGFPVLQTNISSISELSKQAEHARHQSGDEDTNHCDFWHTHTAALTEEFKLYHRKFHNFDSLNLFKSNFRFIR